MKELREAVWRGDSLVMDGEHDDRNQLLHAVVGVKSRGKLGRTNLTTAVPAGSVFPEGSVQALGRPGNSSWRAVSGKQPSQAAMRERRLSSPMPMVRGGGCCSPLIGGHGHAARRRATGEGRWSSWCSYHVASGTPALTQGDTAAIGMRISNQGARPISLRLVGATLPAGASHADALPEAAAQGQAVTWELSLAAGSSQDITWRVRADQAGPLTLPVVLRAACPKAAARPSRAPAPRCS